MLELSKASELCLAARALLARCTATASETPESVLGRSGAG